MYIEFTEKCYNLLDDNGELIFIVPSDFLKLTSASKLLNVMMTNGTFTHIFHPHNEKMFENASIDVIVFRYCKNSLIDKKVLSFIVRLKFQKRSELKFVSRTIPQSGGYNTPSQGWKYGSCFSLGFIPVIFSENTNGSI